MSNTNSTERANQLASPQVHNPKGTHGGRVRVCQGNFEVAAADMDADGDTITLCVLPASARPLEIYIGHDDMDDGTGATWNVGLYPVLQDGTLGTVSDEDAFASAYDPTSAARLTPLIDECGTAASKTFIGDTLWEWSALTVEPNNDIAIVMTQTTATTGLASTVCYQVYYTLD